MLAHQPLHAGATDIDALALERWSAATVAVVGRVHALDALQQPLIADGPDGADAGGALE
jgi:hypothetical protein